MRSRIVSKYPKPNPMPMNCRNALLTLALASALLPFGLRAAQVNTTYTGVVSDDMCGVKHTMDPGHSDAECTRMCVKGGSAYALVVGQKAYTLHTKNAQQAAVLNKYAAKRVVVKGVLKGDTLEVSSVAPATGK